MTAPFLGLETGVRALRAMQTLVDITNNNVANADTPGFSRQSGTVRSTESYPTPTRNVLGRPGQLGTGVEVAAVTRARDTFLDYQIRTQLQIQGRWDTRRDALKQVEATVNEPSTTGLSSLMSR